MEDVPLTGGVLGLDLACRIRTVSIDWLMVVRVRLVNGSDFTPSAGNLGTGIWPRDLLLWL